MKGIFLASIIYIAVLKAKPNGKQGLKINDIESAGYFLSAFTSLLATALIAWRIHTISQESGRSRRRFSNIIEIVVQSALLYSLALLIQGIAFTIPFTSLETRDFALVRYAKIILTYVSVRFSTGYSTPSRQG